MEAAIRLDPGLADAYRMLSQWYARDGLFEHAIIVMQEATSALPATRPLYALPLAECYLRLLRPDAALAIAAWPEATGKAWDPLRARALHLGGALAAPFKDADVSRLYRIATPDAEMQPRYLAGDSLLMYTRHTGGGSPDIYLAARDSCGGWFAGVRLPISINSAAEEVGASISANGHYLCFSRCENRPENGWEGGGCDLFLAYTPDTGWSIPLPFGATINSPAREITPFLSNDNRCLFFASDRLGGYGGTDLYMSVFKDGLWQVPRNLGPVVNTASDELSPFLYSDGRSFCFASGGHGSLGETDLFMCEWRGDTLFRRVSALPYPINSPARETGISLDAEGAQVLFSSNRNGPQDDDDIYIARLPAFLRPSPVWLVNGYVQDSLTEARLPSAHIYITDLQGGDTLYQLLSNRGNGSFSIHLPRGRRYDVHVSRSGYTDSEVGIRTPGMGEDSAIIQELSIPLLPEGYVAPVFDSLLIRVRFASNGAKLPDSALDDIRGRIEPWVKSHQDAQYEVRGYTDDTGSPMVNEQLSFARARVVGALITSLGVAEGQLKVEGWGEASPLATNDTEEGRAENRRVEVRVIYRE
jgi:hypothetical protein